MRSKQSEALTATLKQFNAREQLAIFYDWFVWGREQQHPPQGTWSTWLVMAGRGFGKTRTGAEWIKQQVTANNAGRIALVGPTAADVRDVMIEGESGLLAVHHPKFRPVYEPSKRRVTWRNGAIATTYSAEEPDRLRGPQHDAGWADEISAWQYADAWDQLQFGLRLGSDPRVIATTTPRPVKLVRDILKVNSTVVTRGTTYENRDNLAPTFLQHIIKRYEGTRLGRQELNAELLDDNPDALWRRDVFDHYRVSPGQLPTLKRVVVALDPSATNTDTADEAGIIVAGLGVDGRGYVLDDRTRLDSPLGWARVCVKAYHDYHADRLVGEVNNGGDMVETTIRTVDQNVSYRSVRATRGKAIRAEPVAALYEQGRISHAGFFAKLEDECAEYNPYDDTQRSPNRMDALVWAFYELFHLDEPSTTGLLDFYTQQHRERTPHAR